MPVKIVNKRSLSECIISDHKKRLSSFLTESELNSVEIKLVNDQVLFNASDAILAKITAKYGQPDK